MLSYHWGGDICHVPELSLCSAAPACGPPGQLSAWAKGGTITLVTRQVAVREQGPALS